MNDPKKPSRLHANDASAATNHASIIIADCANQNPNMFYEIGLAHALGKETMLLTQTLDDIRIRLRHLCVSE